MIFSKRARVFAETERFWTFTSRSRAPITEDFDVVFRQVDVPPIQKTPAAQVTPSVAGPNDESSQQEQPVKETVDSGKLPNEPKDAHPESSEHQPLDASESMFELVNIISTKEQMRRFQTMQLLRSPSVASAADLSLQRALPDSGLHSIFQHMRFIFN